MFKLKNRVIALLAVTSLFMCFYSVQGAVDLKDKKILSREGKITEIMPYYGTDGKQSDDTFFVFMSLGKTEAGDENIVSFLINSETERLNDQELAVGATLKAYYDGSLPVILIYPPRYNAVAIEITAADKGTPATDSAPPTPVPPETPATEQQEVAAKYSVIVNGKTLDVPHDTNGDGTIMVPVRAVCEALGYDVRWVSEEKKVQIGVAVSMTIGKDEYIYARMAPFKLGAAPVVLEGVTFAPISFFGDVMRLDCSYSIDGPVSIDTRKS